MMEKSAFPSAIVTGAGSGIGLAIALRLAKDGYGVLVNDLALERAKAVAEEITASGGKASAYAGDVSEETQAAAICAAAVVAHGPVVLLVNNAGIAHQSLFEHLEVADFDRMFAVHVRGNFLMTRAVLPPMLERGDGVIVNIASQLGQIGGVELVHYSGAKAAIIGMTKALAREVSARGVRVNAVAPAQSIRRWSWAFQKTGGMPSEPNCRLAGSVNRRKWPPPSPSLPPRMLPFSSARHWVRIPAM